MSITLTTPDVLTRVWGEEVLVAWTSTHACKVLKRQPGTERASRGFQMHVKEESHYLYAGRMLLETLTSEGAIESLEVAAGSGWTVPPCTFHRETALEACVIIEVSDPIREDRYRSGSDYGGLKSMTDQEASDKLTAQARALHRRALQMERLAVTIQTDGLASLVPRALEPTE